MMLTCAPAMAGAPPVHHRGGGGGGSSHNAGSDQDGTDATRAGGGLVSIECD
ncbi:MAG: hypothetical protein HY744_24580 [Deltaproteobacteria bacterium]|nr:hypothetical protein [Deltaproteobacteria bacterium]